MVTFCYQYIKRWGLRALGSWGSPRMTGNPRNKEKLKDIKSGPEKDKVEIYMHSEEITETRKDRVLSILGEIRKVRTKHYPLISVLEIRTQLFLLEEQSQGRAHSGRPGMVGMLVDEEYDLNLLGNKGN